MIIICCECRTVIGIKRPLFKFARTHGYCKKCYIKNLEDVLRSKNDKIIEQSNEIARLEDVLCEAVQ